MNSVIRSDPAAVPSVQQGDARADLEELFDADAAAETIQATLASVWQSFLGHVPYLLAGVLLLVATTIVAVAVRAVARRLLRRTHLQESLTELLARLLFIAVWVAGLLIVAMVVFPGLTPTKALGGLGIVGVAVGFAFQDIFENFFAGILILWRFPFDKGDFLVSGDISGRVEEITIRNTLIRRPSGELLIVPNSTLFKNPVEVLTDRDSRRVTLLAGVSYDTDVEQAVEVIREALRGCESVQDPDSMQVFPQSFGSSSIDIEVAWWTGAEPLDQRRSRGEVLTAIHRALDRAGIEIPFPYRTLTFKEPLEVQQTGSVSE